MSQERLQELPRFKKRGELTDPAEIAAREELVDFVQTLARAILQNSYYTPDHPSARKTAQEPYEMLAQVGKRIDEFTFVVTSWSEEESVALEGVFSEAIPLETMLVGAAGEHFSKKLFTFCKRNRLVSYSIKNTIHEDEFHRFIGVFVKRYVDQEATRLLDLDGEKGPVFTDQLLDNGVVNVTVVLEDDLVEEKRRLPWRVKIALARLKKDLRAIPIYSKATASELRDAKLRLLRDILRPLRRGAYLKQLFLNLDLIHEEIEELRDVEHIEEDLLDALPDVRVVALGKSLLQEHDRLGRASLQRESADREDLAEAVALQLRMIGRRLATSETTDDVVKLMRELYEAKAVPLSALPPQMQAHVRMDRWTAQFLRDPDQFLTLIESIENPDVYLSQLPDVVSIFPNLLRVKKFEEARRLVEMLERHRTEPGPFDKRQELVNSAMAALNNDVVTDLLVQAMLTEPREVRAIVKRLFCVIGPRAVIPVVRILGSDASEDVRGDAALALVSLGPAAIEHIEAILEDHSTAPEAARYLLKALSELEAVQATDLIADHTRHPKARVRQAALSALAKLHGPASQHVLVRALQDDADEVAAQAIRLLSSQRCRQPAYVLRLLQLLGVAPREDGTEIEVSARLQVAVISALRHLGGLALGELGTIEDVLLDRLNMTEGKVMSILLRGKTGEADQIRVALCDALSEIGGERALERLSNWDWEPSPLVRQRMQQAAGHLERRLSAA